MIYPCSMTDVPHHPTAAHGTLESRHRHQQHLLWATFLTVALVSLGCAAGDPDCANPEPVVSDAGVTTDIEECRDGALNRTAEARPEIDFASTCVDGTPEDCSTSDECTAEELGRCEQYTLQPMGPDFCRCRYFCEQDTDCGPGAACLYGDGGGSCIPADCRSADDCDSGQCGLSVGYLGCVSFEKALVCRSKDDTCRTDTDCEEGQCVADPGGHFRCKSVQTGTCR